MSEKRPVPCIALVVAMDEDRLIGRDGELPWRLPADLRHFRRTTMGHTLLMGRRTFDSLGKPLDGRDNWVVSGNADFQPTGARVFRDVDAAIAAHAEGELMVIGGAMLYEQLLPRARWIHLTEVHARLDGDTWFPALDRSAFRETSREDHPADERHAYSFSFVTLERLG